MANTKVGSAFLEVDTKLKTGSGASDGAAYGNSFSGSMQSTISAGAVAIGNILADLAMQAAQVVAQFIGDSIEVGATYQAAMSQVAATMGYTTEQLADPLSAASASYDALSEKAKELGGSTMYSASQAAEGLNILAMSGFSADESMEMLEDVLHLAAAGGMDLAQAAGYVSGAMKGFNDPMADAQYYADLMAKGATLANTSVSQLGDAISSGAATAAAYGQSADAMTLALLRLAEQGVVGSAAGTALAAAMKNVYTPTDQAAKAMDALGVSAYDAEGNARDFNEVVNDLEASMADMTEEERNAYKQTIFGIQGLDAYNKMTVTGIDKQEQWADALAHASDGMGSAADQYNTMTDNLKGSTQAMGSAMEAVQIAIFEKVEPALRFLVDTATNALSVVAGLLNGEVPEGFEFMGDIATAVTNAIGEVVNTVWPVVQDQITAVMDTVGGVIQQWWPTIQEIVSTVMQTIQGVISVAWPYIQHCIEMAMAAISVLQQTVWPVIQGIVSTVMAAVSGIVSVAWNGITAVIQAAVGIITGVIGGLDVLVQMVTGIFNSVKEAITGPIETAKNTIGEIVAAIEGFFSGMKLEFPPIAVPHFNIYGGEAPWGIAGAGTPPKIDIEWYARGGIVDGATLIGVGEAGPEMILPRQGGLMDEFAQAVASKVDGGISINGPVTVVADDPEEFMDMLTVFASRTRAQYA